ncbi:hypothetical protein L1887_26766 [Cichorium endivia]|nr:hypothetical protein L1887_26766 [Cichorium endivia]
MKCHCRRLLHPSQPLPPFSPSIIEGSDPNRPEVANYHRFSLQQCFLLPNHNLEQGIRNPVFSLYSSLSLSTLTETRFECYDLEGEIRGFSDRLAGTSIYKSPKILAQIEEYRESVKSKAALPDGS